MLPFSFIGTGTYTNAASALPTTVALSAKPDYFMVRDITNYGAASNAAGMVEAWTYPSTMAAGAYRGTGMTNAAAASNTFYGLTGTSNGFTFIDGSNPPTFASLTGTTIDKTTWVVSMTNTGSIAVGDTVRVINPVGMLQAGGITAQVTAVSVNTSITLGYMATAVTNGANFTSNATACSILKYIPGQFYPKASQVIHITQATQAKVYFSKPNTFTPGEIVDFDIPSTYGMTQLTFRTGFAGGAPRVLVVTNTATESSITLDLDTSGFTAFSYPTSAGSVGKASPPSCFPAGSGVVPASGSATVPQSPPGTNLQDAFDNRNQYYMYIGSSVVGANSAVMQWTAFKADFGNLSNA
jgi:hypothetical protein